MKKIIKYVIIDLVRNKIVLAYLFFLLVISMGLFNLEDNTSKAVLSLLNLILIIVPLMSMIFSTIYMYNSSEFIELLVSQPIRRSRLLLSLFGGLSASLMIAFAIGVGIPLMIYSPGALSITLLVNGLVLTVIFVALAILGSVLTRDKAKGIGLALLIWLFFTLIYDGLVLFLLFQFADYPLDKASIVFSSLNPIDLGRIFILLKLDISAMMGYTGAIFKEFFGTGKGMVYAGIILLLWILIPVWLGVFLFRRKDL
jgi:Cu-processing system permease protein